MIKNEIIEVGGRRWKIREAVSMSAAESEIAHARCLGSVGSSTTKQDYATKEVTVIADVVQINSDGTERKPYTLAY